MPFRARTYIGLSVTSVPSRRTRPESGGVSPTTIENVVVLPAPFGPSRPTTSPDAIWRFTPLTTVRPPKDFVRPVELSVPIRYCDPVGQAIGFCTERMTPLPDVDTVPTARWNVRTAPTDFLQSGGVVSTATTGVPVIMYVSVSTVYVSRAPVAVRPLSLMITLPLAPYPSTRSSSWESG